MAKSKEDKLMEVHQRAIKNFNVIFSAVQDERRQCREDRRFHQISGAQWEGFLEDAYGEKAQFEFNKAHLAVKRIISEYRANKMTLDFFPRQGRDEELTAFLNGLHRADEEDSNADDAYANALEESAGGGMGGWRLRTVYEDEYDVENENQRILIEPIFEADQRLFFDQNSKKQDKSDAKHAFLFHAYTPEAFEEEFGEDEMPATWSIPLDDDNGQGDWDWETDDVVYVAEYFEVEDKYQTWVYMSAQWTDEEKRIKLDDMDKEKGQTLIREGWFESRRRKIKERKVHKYILSGQKVLEDCDYIAGREIPLVATFGERAYVDNIERAMGVVRLVKDVNRLNNIMVSKIAMSSTTSSEELPIFDPEQLEGLELPWANRTIENKGFLLAKTLTDDNGAVIQSGPSGYLKPPSIDPNTAALVQICDTALKEISGSQEQGDVISANTSGKTVELVQNRLDQINFVITDNQRKARKRSGEIYISMAKDIYIDDEREMKVIDEDGNRKMKKLKIQEANGTLNFVTGIEDNEFDVITELGPSTTSQRAASFREHTNMLNVIQDPELRTIHEAYASMNMEGDGKGGLREYARKKLVAMGVLDPTEEDVAEAEANAANQKPSPNDELLLSAAEKERAEAAKLRADTLETTTKASLNKANEAKIQAEAAKMMAEAQGGQGPSPEDMKAIADAMKLRADMLAQQEELELKARQLDLEERKFARDSIQNEKEMRRDRLKERLPPQQPKKEPRSRGRKK